MINENETKTNQTSGTGCSTKERETKCKDKKTRKSQRTGSGKNDRYPGRTARNDWKFYAPSEQIAKDVSSLPFNYITGRDFPIDGHTSKGVQSIEINKVKYGRSLPTVMMLDYVESVGVAKNASDGVNMASKQLYTQIRKSNSGAKNYDAQEVMLYILALKELYGSYFQAKKILGLVNNYHFMNHTIPEGIIYGHGIDYKDLRSNIAQYRGRLNILASKINSFSVPKYFNVFKRSAYIGGNIFMDSTSKRGQMYAFHKLGYRIWSSLTNEEGTELIFKYQGYGSTGEGEGSLNKFSYLLDGIDLMLNQLFTDTDALTISGDILKAFGENGLFAVEPVSTDYVTPIVMDEDILAQIENSQCIQTFYTGNIFTKTNNEVVEEQSNDAKTFNVTQSVGSQLILYQPTITMEGVGDLNTKPFIAMDKYLFNSHKDNPEYTDVLEWSRLITHTDVDFNVTDNKVVSTVVSTGLETLLEYRIVEYFGNVAEQEPMYATLIEFRNSGMISSAGTLDSNLLPICCFDWHPTLYLPGSMENTISVCADVKVATQITPTVISAINDAAVYGAYYDSMA